MPKYKMPCLRYNSSYIILLIKDRNHFPSQMVSFLTYDTFEYKNECERYLPK